MGIESIDAYHQCAGLTLFRFQLTTVSPQFHGI